MNFDTKNIKELRLHEKISQEEIAKKLNVSRSSYAMWESNNNIFPINRLVDICNIFNVSLDYALGLNKKNKVSNAINPEKAKDRLKEFRKDNNLTQEKLANFLNTNKSVICNYEKGRNIIATPFLYDICRKYKISADYLLGRTDNPKYIK